MVKCSGTNEIKKDVRISRKRSGPDALAVTMKLLRPRLEEKRDCGDVSWCFVRVALLHVKTGTVENSSRREIDREGVRACKYGPGIED